MTTIYKYSATRLPHCQMPRIVVTLSRGVYPIWGAVTQNLPTHIQRKTTRSLKTDGHWTCVLRFAETKSVSIFGKAQMKCARLGVETETCTFRIRICTKKMSSSRIRKSVQSIPCLGISHLGCPGHIKSIWGVPVFYIFVGFLHLCELWWIFTLIWIFVDFRHLCDFLWIFDIFLNFCGFLHFCGFLNFCGFLGIFTFLWIFCGFLHF